MSQKRGIDDTEPPSCGQFGLYTALLTVILSSFSTSTTRQSVSVSTRTVGTQLMSRTHLTIFRRACDIRLAVPHEYVEMQIAILRHYRSAHINARIQLRDGDVPVSV